MNFLLEIDEIVEGIEISDTLYSDFLINKREHVMENFDEITVKEIEKVIKNLKKIKAGQTRVLVQ